MPVYNEEATAKEAIQRVFDTELPVQATELVAVDAARVLATLLRCRFD